MKKVITLTIIVVAVTCLSSMATVIHIPGQYSTIQEGIDNSSDGDTVLVQPGIYVENINFDGHNITVGSMFLTTGDTSYISSTIIDGDSSGTVVTFENGEDSTAVIAGFTIRNGSTLNGGGIYCMISGPTITNNIISENSAINYGGGIYCLASDVTITDNTISENLAGPRGGGIHCEGGSDITISNNTISGNTAQKLPNLGHGAGISCKDGPVVTISENDISGNYAYVAAGGIWSNCNTTIVRNTITGNIAEKNHGGGIVCFYAFEITNNTITRNSVADLGTGGGLYSSRATPIVTNTIVYDNYAPEGYENEVSGTFTITYSDIKEGWPGTGNIDADPLFRDTTSGDYHLMATYCGDPYDSPCIDAGAPSIFDITLDCAWGLGEYRSDVGAYGGGRTQPSVSIDMTPDNPPVQVPAGGSFSFTGELENNTPDPQTVDVWIMLRLPGGATYGPLIEYNNLTLIPYGHPVVTGITQDVPWYAPLGTYDYIAYCGNYPSDIIDSSQFEFTVVAPENGTADNWNLSGWFDDNVDQSSELPSDFALSPNYPNSFNSTTTFNYQLPINSDVKLVIYNLMGQKVETLVDDRLEAGYHSIQWDASNFSSGIYFYKLTAGDKVFTRRMTLLK